MPIYMQEDHQQVIERIKGKIKDLSIMMGEVLPENVIVDFETQCGIRLPQAYRLFLQEVGNGCEDMLDGFSLKRLEDMPRKDLTRPFGLDEAWIWEDDDQLEGDSLEQVIESSVFQGEIALIEVGCGISYHLIVSGKCQGEVWCFTDVGVQPCCERQDFLGWFELWLDQQESVDYFQDYQ